MSYRIVDQRKTDGGRSRPNRERLLRREHAAIKEKIRESLLKGKIKNFGSEESRKIKISQKNLQEPAFRHSGSGIYDYVLPGNKFFKKGDMVPRPQGSDGHGGSGGSSDGEGQEDFLFEMSEEAYLELLLDDLKLPDMVKKRLTGSEEKQRRNAGFTKEGPLSRASIPRSFGQARIRRKASILPRERKIRELMIERVNIEEELKEDPCASSNDSRRMRIEEIDREIEGLRRKIRATPFLDPIDMSYKNFVEEPKPVANAVMLCIIDASASVTEDMKELAKIFFWLLLRFLTRNYKHVEVVFIRHTSTAKEVDEEEFFKGQETGGTVISTAYEEMIKIIAERFPLEEWNIYGCQGSDGDNFHDDMDKAVELLGQHILPIVQYFAYVEIRRNEMTKGDIWERFVSLATANSRIFAMAHVQKKEDIYPVFRSLFEREGVQS